MLPLYCRVVLRSFNGTLSTPPRCDPSEDYWSLIGESGTVVKTIDENARVLVKFDRSVSARGLHCHNPVPNSLFILETDLETTQQGRE